MGLVGETRPVFYMLIVKKMFCGHGYNMPNVGSIIDPPADVSAHLLKIGVADEYETKIVTKPVATKKKSSASSQPGPASRGKTAKKRGKSAKK